MASGSGGRHWAAEGETGAYGAGSGPGSDLPVTGGALLTLTGQAAFEGE